MPEFLVAIACGLPGLVMYLVAFVRVAQDSRAGRRATPRTFRLLKLGIAVMLLGMILGAAAVVLAHGRPLNALIVLALCLWLPALWFIRAARTRVE